MPIATQLATQASKEIVNNSATSGLKLKAHILSNMAQNPKSHQENIALFNKHVNQGLKTDKTDLHSQKTSKNSMNLCEDFCHAVGKQMNGPLNGIFRSLEAIGEHSGQLSAGSVMMINCRFQEWSLSENMDAKIASGIKRNIDQFLHNQ